MEIKNVYLLLIIVLLITSLISTFGATYYHYKYDLAIKEGAKDIVTALEMVVACQTLSNVTNEQIKEQYIKMFILENTSGIRIDYHDSDISNKSINHSLIPEQNLSWNNSK